MKVAVGSNNPVKKNATKLAFETIWPEESWEIIGVEVKSGISNQPMSDEEAIKGATNRAKKALKKVDADFGVGLEGGLNQIGQHWFDCGWAVVVNKSGNLGIGSSCRIKTPSSMIKLIKKGYELGTANDKIFGRTNSKQSEGHFGLMTKNAITRTSGYRDGLIMALTRFIHPEIF